MHLNFEPMGWQVPTKHGLYRVYDFGTFSGATFMPLEGGHVDLGTWDKREKAFGACDEHAKAYALPGETTLIQRVG